MRNRKMWNDGLNDFPEYFDWFELRHGCFEGDGGGGGGGGGGESAGYADVAGYGGLGSYGGYGDTSEVGLGDTSGLGGWEAPPEHVAAPAPDPTPEPSFGGLGSYGIYGDTSEVGLPDTSPSVGTGSREMPTALWGTVPLTTSINPDPGPQDVDLGLSFAAESGDPGAAYGEGAVDEIKTATAARTSPYLLSSPYQKETRALGTQQAAPTTWSEWGAQRSA